VALVVTKFLFGKHIPRNEKTPSAFLARPEPLTFAGEQPRLRRHLFSELSRKAFVSPASLSETAH
jgi:hypothetical protein